MFDLSEVGYVSTFDKHMFSLQAAKHAGHHCTIKAIGGTALLNVRMVFPSCDNFDAAKDFVLPPSVEDNATNTPGKACSKRYDINCFHCSCGRLHEALLHDTAR